MSCWGGGGWLERRSSTQGWDLEYEYLICTVSREEQGKLGMTLPRLVIDVA